MHCPALCSAILILLFVGCSKHNNESAPFFNDSETVDREFTPGDLNTSKPNWSQGWRFNNGMIILMNHDLPPAHIEEYDSFNCESLADTIYYNPFLRNL